MLFLRRMLQPIPVDCLWLFLNGCVINDEGFQTMHVCRQSNSCDILFIREAISKTK